MKKSIVSVVLVGVLVLMTVFSTGCQQSKRSNGATDEQVTLKWVLGGPGKQIDSDEVWAEFNKLLATKMPNTQVAFDVIPLGDYAEKWKLIAAAGENVDMAWHGWMVPFDQEVNKGAYMPLDDLLTNYAPKLKESMPDWVWSTAMVNGKIYAIPNYQMMVNRPGAFRTPGELADKYLDKEAIREAFHKLSEITTPTDPINDECFDLLEEYLAALKANGELGMGFSPEIFTWFGEMGGHEMQVETGYIYNENGKWVVKNGYDKDVSTTFYKRLAEFYEKGYIRKDALTVQDFEKDKGVEGGYTLWYHQYDDFTAEQESLQYNMPIYLIEKEFKSRRYTSIGGTNSVIPSSAENPVRAIQLYELINTDPELYNMLVFGLEDKHYVKTGNNTIETLDYDGTPTAESGYGIQKWIIGNTFNAFSTQTDVPEYSDYILNVLHPSTDPGPLDGFVFDRTPVKSELVQIANIKSEFNGLRTGAFKNWEEMVDKMREKMKVAGNDKVIAEIQRQLDEWLANNNK